MRSKECNAVDFESSFADFIDQQEYDEAENVLFSMIRTSFKAGWLAAGGNPPSPPKVFEIYLYKPPERKSM